MPVTPKRYVSRPLLYPNVVEEREYQVKIARKAYDRNTLVILPTALGKTVISALLVSEVLYNYRNSRVLVMAPTRPLVLQHRSSFQRMIRLPEDQFALLTGKTPADYRASVWAGKPRLVFATPEVVRNDLLQGRLSLKGFGLLVFDECHRSVKEYAYTEVASSYLKGGPPYPLILGMTASPGSDADRVAAVCKSLFIERVEHRSETDDDVRPYINPITVESRSVALPAEYLPAMDRLRGMLDQRVRSLQSKGILKKAFVSKRDLIEAGAELRYQAEMSMEEESPRFWGAISLQSQALTVSHMIELLETQGAYTLKCFVDRLSDGGKKSHVAVLADPALADVRRQLLDAPGIVEHPKVGELVRIVSGQVRSDPSSRMLVFTQFRDTASHLVDELKKVEGVRAERFVGQASKLRDRGLTQDEQASLIEDLRKGYVNALCCTSIAEEGLDIPEVDLVVFYEPIPSEIRYIQRRGRTGRKAAGRAIILATEGTADTSYLHAAERRTELMKTIASSLDQGLKPVARQAGMPPPEPMSEGALVQLEKLRPEAPLTAVKEEYERVKRFDRLVARAVHDVYMRMLQEGAEGFEEELLYSEMGDQGLPRPVVAAALRKLLKGRYLSNPRDRVSLAVKDIPGVRAMSIEVEKVALGGANVVVDGKWPAWLESANYDGPRELMKKGKRFKALCELYNSAGVLNVNIRQVIQAG